MKMIRYADDFVILVHGTRDDARALRAEVGRVLAPMGLRLSADKTRLTHIEEGFEFLGWRIQRRKKKGTRGTTRVYTYPSKKSLASIIDRIRILTRRTAHRTLADLLRRLNPAIRGWCAYFQHGVSKRTFCYVDNFAFRRILGWLYKRHPRLNKHTVNRRFLPGWRIRDDGIEFFRACRVPVTRYRYRGTRIPSPRGGERHGITRVESRMRRNAHVRFGGRPAETHPRKRGQGAAGRPYTYIRTWVGFVYLATVLDCCTKKVVGYAMADNMKTDLICKAIDMAVRRCPHQEEVTIFHSDRGSQYTSQQFAKHLKNYKILPSVGRTGVCWDNAWAESFNATPGERTRPRPWCTPHGKRPSKMLPRGSN